jgi:2-polyprenyl-3-methyl-5-hydroxy-6-metoxy-1,4-benzoquinol methylase
MKVAIEKMVVNRSSLTREFGIAGIPVLQMYTHAPFLIDCKNEREVYKSQFGTLPYNTIQKASKRGGHTTFESLDCLVNDIAKSGVKESLDGWPLCSHNIFELYGGHHRAIIAWGLGFRHLECRPKSFDIYSYMPREGIESIRKVYNTVYDHEVLRKGFSYNPFPGFKSIRPTADWRLQKIYQQIISCRGDKLLDLGCNDGYFGVGLMPHDFDITFVDRSPFYMKVVEEKVKALKRKACFSVIEIGDFLTSTNKEFNVTIYMDVFYHTILESGIDTAVKHLNSIIDKTSECLIISPGRWDKLYAKGMTKSKFFDLLKRNSRVIRYLGKDNDLGYQRELFAVSY